MTIRDFFRILIKLFCVYSLVQVSLYYIPLNAFGLIYSYDIVWSLISLIILIAISIVIFVFLTKKIDSIIDWLKLDKGFDQNLIQIGSFNEHKVYSIAIILIGGMLIVDYLPSFLNHLYTSFRQKAGGSNLQGLLLGEESTNYFDWGISAMNMIIGYLIIMNHSFLSKKLTKLTIQDDFNSEEE